jgi:lipoprotein-anchoring transpeptidase ErfK/SrfK
MEPRFGNDFSQVRVHMGGKAAESARVVNALAYKVGRDMVFEAGQYAPSTVVTHRLLAHELAHVVQQRASVVQRQFVGSVGEAFEMEAERAAQGVLSEPETLREHKQVSSGHTVLQRQMPSSDDIAGISEESVEEDVSELEQDEAMDGDLPLEATFPVGELSLAQLTGETESAEEGEPLRPSSNLADIQQTTSETGVGQHVILRQSRARAPSITPPPASRRGRWISRIEINLSSQRLTIVWSDGQRGGPYTLSSGRGCPNTRGNPCASPNRRDSYCTPTGAFSVQGLGGASYRNRFGDAMSWFVVFNTTRGIGIHDSQPVTGRPASHGCVRIGEAVARQIHQNVTSRTDIVVTGIAPARPWRGSISTYPGCPAAPPRQSPAGSRRRRRRGT